MISLAFRRQAVNRMCDILHERLRLSERPTAIAAPPSNAPEGPAVAILIDTTKVAITADDEIQVDDDNQPLIGALATLEHAPNIDLGGGVYLSHVGSMICRGRIWVGARLAPKREELEARIMRVFFEDTENLGIWNIEIPNPQLGEYTLPCSWQATAIIGESTWTSEYAFAERLWSWLTFELELAILVPRDNPAHAIVQQFIFGFDVHVDHPVESDGPISPDDADGEADNEYYTGYPPRRVDSSGE
jgi:hypothetical protein